MDQCQNNHREIILANDDFGWTILNKAIDQVHIKIIENLLECFGKQYLRILKEILIKVDNGNEETVLHQAANERLFQNYIQIVISWKTFSEIDFFETRNIEIFQKCERKF